MAGIDASGAGRPDMLLAKAWLQSDSHSTATAAQAMTRERFIVSPPGT